VKLVLYGGGHEEENLHLDAEAIRLARVENPRVTYIPSCSFDSEADFIAFVQSYRKLGLTKFIHFPIDVPYDQVLLSEAFSSDIIHLSGGNTFYFLKYLKKTKILSKLKEFVRNGGVLTGMSAGAIIMTPDIKTAGYPKFDCDDNDEKITNLKAMNIVPFEFFPHYKNSDRYEKELIFQSKKVKHPVYAVPDLSGIVVEGNTLKFVGKTVCFLEGKKIPLSNHLRLV
jgi:dipeptidase E